MAEKKSRWGKKKESKEPAALPVLPVRKIDYELPDAICMAVENYFTIAECEHYMQVLKDQLKWAKKRVDVGGFNTDRANVMEPRLTLFMSDPGICYEYSGAENVGVDWHPIVLEIKEKAERAVEECGLPAVCFNSVQLNRYEGARHALGFHADNEPDLVKGGPIASVSFGATRDFVILDRVEPDNRRWNVPLRDGCFFLMGGNMQNRYLHGVPAGKADGVGLRINLTFRLCIPRERDQGPAARSRQEEEEEVLAAAEERAIRQGDCWDSDRPPAASSQPPLSGPAEAAESWRAERLAGERRFEPPARTVDRQGNRFGRRHVQNEVHRPQDLVRNS